MEINITDIHTHILPGIDDGSKSVEETIKILDIMSKSGVNNVVATPHFYGERMSVEEFEKNRREAFEKILNHVPDGMKVVLGAEVKLEYDLHKLELSRLAIEGTDYILIEMPYVRWDPWVFEELFKITSRHKLEIIIAHIDRYMDMVSDEKLRELFKMSLKYQVNVDFLGGLFKKSEAMELIRNDIPHFIGSDCHNLTTRPPCFADAVKKIDKKCGREYIEYYMANADKMLKNKSI